MTKCPVCNGENASSNIFCEFCGQRLLSTPRGEEKPAVVEPVDTDTRVRIKHLSGGRAQQEDVFGIHDHELLIMGRDPAAQIKFDPERDMVVSRQHAAIAIDSRRDDSFQVMDLGSSNGVFINGTQVTGKAKLKHGDVIRVGAEGPEVRFLRDPAPEDELLETLIVRPQARRSTPNVYIEPAAAQSAVEGGIGWLGRVKNHVAAAIAALGRVFR